MLLAYREPAGDAIEVELRLPSGLPGLRCTGHPVIVRIDRAMLVEVRSPSSERAIARGSWDFVNGVCWEAGTFAPDAELAHTAIAMIEAFVDGVVRLFRRGYLDRRWLEERARYDVAL